MTYALKLFTLSEVLRKSLTLTVGLRYDSLRTCQNQMPSTRGTAGDCWRIALLTALTCCGPPVFEPCSSMFADVFWTSPRKKSMSRKSVSRSSAVPADYDTAADNTVRVHASMLRKRVNQYFENEGSAETLVIEIPRGNYAPVFRERADQTAGARTATTASATAGGFAGSRCAAPAPSGLWVWLPSVLAALFAATSLVLYMQERRLAKASRR